MSSPEDRQEGDQDSVQGSSEITNGSILRRHDFKIAAIVKAIDSLKLCAGGTATNVEDGSIGLELAHFQELDGLVEGFIDRRVEAGAEPWPNSPRTLRMVLAEIRDKLVEWDLIDDEELKSGYIQAILDLEKELCAAKKQPKGSPVVEALIEKVRILAKKLAAKDFQKEEVARFPKGALLQLASACRLTGNKPNEITANLALLDKNLDKRSLFLILRSLRDGYEELEDLEKALEFAERLMLFLEAQDPNDEKLKNVEGHTFLARHNVICLKRLAGKTSYNDTVKAKEFYHRESQDRSASTIKLVICHKGMGSVALINGEFQAALNYYREAARLESSMAGGIAKPFTNATIVSIKEFLESARNISAAEVIAGAEELPINELKFWSKVLREYPRERIAVCRVLLAKRSADDVDAMIQSRVGMSFAYEELGQVNEAIKEIFELKKFQKERGLDEILSDQRLEFLRRKRNRRYERAVARTGRKDTDREN